MSTVNKLSENYTVYIFYEDDASAGVQLPADAQAATVNVPFIGWIPFEEFEKGMCLVFNIAGAQACATIRIVSQTNGTGGAAADRAVKTLTTPANIDGTLEVAMLEWTASDITDGDTHITCDLDQAGADPLVVVFILENRRYKRTGLTTADETAST